MRLPYTVSVALILAGTLASKLVFDGGDAWRPHDGPALVMLTASIILLPCAGIADAISWWRRRRALGRSVR